MINIHFFNEIRRIKIRKLVKSLCPIPLFQFFQQLFLILIFIIHLIILFDSIDFQFHDDMEFQNFMTEAINLIAAIYLVNCLIFNYNFFHISLLLPIDNNK